MQFGWCAPLKDADLIKEAGFDYIEYPLAAQGLEDRDDVRGLQEGHCGIAAAGRRLQLFPAAGHARCRARHRCRHASRATSRARPS